MRTPFTTCDVQWPVYVGFSGGVDSTVLLHQLAQHTWTVPLQAIHVHHGLMPEADAWAAHCQHYAASLNIPCMVVKVRVNVGNVEAEARKARYGVFWHVLQQPGYVLLAHHANDQAETIIGHWLRGSGPSGLSGMRAYRPLHQGWLIRPFLYTSKVNMLHYAMQHQLPYIEDASNQDTQRTRSWIRHCLLPCMMERFPSLIPTLQRNADIQAYYAEQPIALNPNNAHALPLDTLFSLNPVAQALTIRRWLERLSAPLPGLARIRCWLKHVRTARHGTLWRWHDVTMGIYKRTWTAYRLRVVPYVNITWSGKGAIHTPYFFYDEATLKQWFLTHTLVLTTHLEACYGKKTTVWKAFDMPAWLHQQLVYVLSDNRLVSICIIT
jgi:tRNA(Ile)-lysidine synthase